MLSAIKTFVFGKASSNLEQDPGVQKLYLAYTQFISESRNGIFVLLTSEGRKAHLLKMYVPLPYDEFCRRVEHMDSDRRASFEEKMLAGYESGKERVRAIAERVVAQIKEKYGS